MPHAELPSTLRGWLVALLASFIGLISGFATIRLLGRAG